MQTKPSTQRRDAYQDIYTNESRGGMHNEGVPLHSNVMLILVAAQCYWMRKIREFPPLRRN